MVPLLHRLIPGWGSRNGEHSDASSAAASALLGESPELLAASGLRGFLATQPLRPTLPLESLWQSGVAPAEPPADGGIGAGGACGDQEDSSSSGDSAVRLEFPCALRPAVGAGKLDLQLRLFQLHVGEPLAGSGAAGGGATRSASSSSNANCSSSTTNSSSDGDTAGLSSLRRCAARTPCSQPVPELLSVLDKAAGLLAAHLLFPGAALPAMRLLAAAHCASAAVQVAGRAVRAAAPRGALKRAAPLPQLADAGRRLARLLQQHGEPALLLLAAAALWVHVHPTSAQIGKCVAALIPVLAGYNQTARTCIQMGLSGSDAEELWHKQHKWAARRTAALLSDLPDTPPLAGVVSAWEALDISIAASVGGLHFGGLFGSGGGAGGLQLSASLGARSRASRQEGGQGLAVAPGHVAATPAGPVEQEPVSGSEAGSKGSAEDWHSVEAAAALHELWHDEPECPPEALAAAAAADGQWQPAVDVQEVAAAAGCASAGTSSGRGAPVRDSPSEMPCSPQRGWSWEEGEDAAATAAAAAVREAAAAAAAAADFMHPAAWAAARQAALQEALAAGGIDAHSTSTSSVADSSSCSVHSFLLPGKRYSSSEESSQVAEEDTIAVGTAAAAAAAADIAAAEQQQAAAEEGWEPEAAAPGAAASGAVEAEEAPLLLFGQADHLTAARPLTAAEKVQLAVRAAQLLTLFAPFIVLGGSMLLLASQLDAAAARRRAVPQLARSLSNAGGVAAAEQAAEAANADGEAVPLSGRLRTAAFKLLLRACRRAGAAFIKWGQWSSTREDIFPLDFCRVMSELHDRAPTHSIEGTRRTVEAAFGAPLESLFLSFEPTALASGSIAQVHRARMLVEGREQVVAVKVRHPGVATCIWQDFQLLRPLAALTARIKSLRSLNLSDSVSQFSHTMTAQADLRVEAAHLRRFYHNFRSVGSAVHVPRPLEGYCTESVLVETFEEGRSVAHFMRRRHPQNTQIVSLGVDTYLKMLLSDNFVHTDLHPGNILVRSRSSQHNGNGSAHEPNGAQGADADAGDCSSGGGDGSGGPLSAVELVLLDFGLAEELTPRVRTHFISFLHMIAKGDGRRAADHLLHWSTNQRCPDRAAFVADMEAMFGERCSIDSGEGIDLDAVMKGVLHLARKHEVSIDSCFAALVIGVCVIVGFATSLDPRVNLMDAATPCFLYHSLTGRVSGRLYM